MRLTVQTDYALRVLMYAGAAAPRLVTIDEVAAAYAISRNHLMKVVNRLAQGGYVKSVRGRAGGFTLGRHPQKIKLSDVVRYMEDDFALVECGGDANRCRITKVCRLKGALGQAMGAFFTALDSYTLESILLDPDHVKVLRAG